MISAGALDRTSQSYTLFDASGKQLSQGIMWSF